MLSVLQTFCSRHKVLNLNLSTKREKYMISSLATNKLPSEVQVGNSSKPQFTLSGPSKTWVQVPSCRRQAKDPVVASEQ
jgi:hypothetical protein